MNNENVLQFHNVIKSIRVDEKNKELKKKKRILQDILLKELIKQNIPYVQVGTDLYLVKKIRKVKPILDEEFISKCYIQFIKTQKQYINNGLAFGKYVSYCQRVFTTTKITGQLSSKLPDDTFQFEVASTVAVKKEVPMTQ